MSISTWQLLYLDALKNAPPKDEPQPLANKKSTMLGITITFLTVAWCAVFFRFYVRIKIVKKLGWDDAFVLLAQVCESSRDHWYDNGTKSSFSVSILEQLF
ncbi:hypothetical protein A1F99_076350 [Pyrenophora tritici-repentis]|nr:hypothetical protein A1F99_076350 [Pyrenophora tritici-repentis]